MYVIFESESIACLRILFSTRSPALFSAPPMCSIFGSPFSVRAHAGYGNASNYGATAYRSNDVKRKYLLRFDFRLYRALCVVCIFFWFTERFHAHFSSRVACDFCTQSSNYLITLSLPVYNARKNVVKDFKKN